MCTRLNWIYLGSADFKPRDDPFILYEELKEALKKANPQLVTRLNEEEKTFKHERDRFGEEARKYVDKVTSPENLRVH